MHNFRLLSTKCLPTAAQNRLIQAGASYNCWNFIENNPKPFEAEVRDKALIFTSQNAVNAVIEHLQLNDNPCYCVGEKTKKRLEENGQKVVKMTQNAADLADFILKNVKNASFLFFTGAQRMPVIEVAFQAHQRQLEVVEVYTTTARPKAVGQFDAVLFYSPSGVESFHQDNKLDQAQGFALGNTTAEALKKYTHNIITAKQPTIEHLTATVRKYITTLA